MDSAEVVRFDTSTRTCEHHACRCIRAEQLARIADITSDGRFLEEAVATHQQRVPCRMDDDYREEPPLQTVVIPAREEHDGMLSLTVVLPWQCMHCGGPRGKPVKGISYDGSRRLQVDTWVNPCGHVEKYGAVREWLRKRRLL